MSSLFCYVATGALRDSLRPSRIASPQDRPEGLAQKQCGIDRGAASWFALEALGATSGPHPLGIALVLPFVAALIPAPLTSPRKRPRAELPRQYRPWIALGPA